MDTQVAAKEGVGEVSTRLFFEIGFTLLFGKNSSPYDFGFSCSLAFSIRRLVRMTVASLDTFLFGFILSRYCCFDDVC